MPEGVPQLNMRLSVSNCCSFARKEALTKHVHKLHDLKASPSSRHGTKDKASTDEGEYDALHSSRSIRTASTSTMPSQDLIMQPTQHIQHHHNEQRFGGPPHHGAAAQAVHLSSNPSNTGPQAPPMYYSAPDSIPSALSGPLTFEGNA